jgi:hypothetical protein
MVMYLNSFGSMAAQTLARSIMGGMGRKLACTSLTSQTP